MINQELLNYLEKVLNENFPEDQIRRELLGAGWLPDDINGAFAQIKSKKASAEKIVPTPKTELLVKETGPQTPKINPQKIQEQLIHQDKEISQEKPGSPSKPATEVPIEKPEVRSITGVKTLQPLEKLTADIKAPPNKTPDLIKRPPAQVAPPFEPTQPSSVVSVPAKRRRRKLLKIIVIILTLALIGGGLAFAYWQNYWPFPLLSQETLPPPPVAVTPPPPPPPEPGVTTSLVSWSPAHLIVTLTPGDTKLTQATATIRSDILAISTEVVPSLASYVSVEPSSFPPLSAGSELTFELFFDVPLDTPLGTIDGTLHLVSGKATTSQPLPITLNIWPSLQGDGGVFQYPPSWAARSFPREPDKFPLLAVTSPAGSDVVILREGGSAYDIGQNVLSSTTQMLIDGHPATRMDYVGTDGVVYLIRIVFMPPLPQAPNFQIEFRLATGDLEAEAAFEQILQTLQLKGGPTESP